MDTLETERLKLRQWNESDFGKFAQYYANEDNARYVGGQKDSDQAWRHMALELGHWTLMVPTASTGITNSYVSSANSGRALRPRRR